MAPKSTLLSDVRHLDASTELPKLRRSREALYARIAKIKGDLQYAEETKNLGEELNRIRELIADKTSKKIQQGLQSADASLAQIVELAIGARGELKGVNEEVAEGGGQSAAMGSQSAAKDESAMDTEAIDKDDSAMGSETAAKDEAAMPSQAVDKDESAMGSEIADKDESSIQSEAVDKDEAAMKAEAVDKDESAVQSQAVDKDKSAMGSETSDKDECAMGSDADESAMGSDAADKDESAMQLKGVDKDESAMGSDAAEKDESAMGSKGVDKDESAMGSDAADKDESVMGSEAADKDESAMQSKGVNKDESAMQSEAIDKDESAMQSECAEAADKDDDYRALLCYHNQLVSLALHDLARMNSNIEETVLDRVLWSLEPINGTKENLEQATAAFLGLKGSIDYSFDDFKACVIEFGVVPERYTLCHDIVVAKYSKAFKHVFEIQRIFGALMLPSQKRRRLE